MPIERVNVGAQRISCEVLARSSIILSGSWSTEFRCHKAHDDHGRGRLAPHNLRSDRPIGPESYGFPITPVAARRGIQEADDSTWAPIQCSLSQYNLGIEPRRPFRRYAKSSLESQPDSPDGALVEKAPDQRHSMRHAARRVELG